jgi:GntR family transcriptional regulator
LQLLERNGSFFVSFGQFFTRVQGGGDRVQKKKIRKNLIAIYVYHSINTVMIIQIDHHSGVAIYQQLVEQVKFNILSGRLKSGEQITSVRDLAKELKINPMTISKAYTLLEKEGFLERERGVGLFVSKIEEKDKDDQKRALLLEILKRAVGCALQLGIDEEELKEQLLKEYSKSDMRKLETV